MGLISLNMTTVICNVVNVLIFFCIIKFFFWKPITNIMEKRQELIDADLKDAKVKNEEAEQLKKDYESALADAKEEAAGIVEEARKRSLEEREVAVKQTQEETARMMEQAKNSIELERCKALQEVQTEIASIAMVAAQKVIEKNIDNEMNQQYLDDFLNEAGGKG